MKSIHITLKEIRKSLEMSQEEVARALGIQTTTYSKIERGAIQLTVNRLADLAKIFNLQAEDILNYGKSKRGKKLEKGNITYIPIHAQAGFLNNYTDQSTLEKFTTFNIPVFTEQDLYMISVEGDSMYPTITSGTFIIIKEVTDTQYIKWGEPHVVVSRDGRVLKRVLLSKAPESIALYSDNRLYQAYDIPKSQIISFWQVLGQISSSFAPKMIFNEEYE